MISESEFVNYINLIEKGLEQRRKFDKAMTEFNTSFFVSNIGEDWLNGLVALLETIMDDKLGRYGSYISWWLFDNRTNRRLILADENEGSTSIDLSTPELLYKWLSNRNVD